VRNPGGQLTQSRHLLGVQQAGLRRLQLAECPLGGVTRRVDLFLGALPLGDVTVDDYEPAPRHGIAAHLDNASVGARVLEAQFLVDRLETAAEFRRDALGAEFAALGEETEIIGIVRAIRQQRVGKLEDPLGIEVPGGEPQFPVEHSHPVAHIVECNAQLGLALADLVEQPGIVHRNHRLRREVLKQRDFFLGEWSYFRPSGGDDPKKLALSAQRNTQQCTSCCCVAGVVDEGKLVPRYIEDMREWFAIDQRLGSRIVRGRIAAPQFLSEAVGQPARGAGTEILAVVKL